ncbi:gamma-glutamyltransferase [Streptantibioticus rubrisoli]|uniref:Gamma-glutamyltransferase family protein n=1 Tax=Streptantibioticus rubrisoli TaxID=1387313 RepID=A0ABT1PC14_9ACTN|nr:gamma-glutamyltransferase [Streptantibioticus rubrisoli]MCQ4041850.1 gamma-glutamyltransferase family protein [Streptantibioticus rubrisoli]
MRVILRERQQWGNRALASTGSSLATFAALTVMEEGGTAFDAAITASALLTVCMPMASGPGGDAAAVLHVSGKTEPLALTSLGRAPRAADPEAFRTRGLTTVPRTGILSATTPALVDAWYAVHESLGTRPLEHLLRPAVRAAAEGAPVTGQLQRWAQANLAVLEQPEFQRTYTAAAQPDAVGTRLRQPGLARLYTMVGRLGAEDLRQEVGTELDAVSAQFGGLLASGDMTRSHARIDSARTLEIAGHQIAVPPAPTQGPLMLQNLALYAPLAPEEGSHRAAGIHLLAEVFNQTFGWRLKHLRDPEAGTAAPDPLAPQTLAELSRGIDPDKRSPCRYAGHYSHGDTTHFVLADRFGNAVTWVQSLGLGFGAGVGVPKLGLLLCNRLGRSATLSAGHANRVRPGARPVNTIFPWTISDGRTALRLGGTPGGDGQCQWNTQVAAGLLFDRATPLRALSLPRWTYFPGSDKIEAGRREQLHADETLEESTVAELERRGHEMVRKASVGGANRLLEAGSGALYGLDDGRQEGLTAAC